MLFKFFFHLNQAVGAASLDAERKQEKQQGWCGGSG